MKRLKRFARTTGRGYNFITQAMGWAWNMEYKGEQTMSDNKNENVVIAFYQTADAAEAAVEALKSWDKASDAVKFGAVGTLVATPDGRSRRTSATKPARALRSARSLASSPEYSPAAPR